MGNGFIVVLSLILQSIILVIGVTKQKQINLFATFFKVCKSVKRLYEASSSYLHIEISLF